MNGTVHTAIGLIIASITNIYLDLNFWTFGCIVAASFCPDFDILMSKYARNQVHRNLFTHSIYIPISLMIIGSISRNILVFLMGIAYLSHILIDMIDYEVDLFFNKHNVGLMLLGRGKEELIESFKTRPIKDRIVWFIYNYYESKFIWIFEIGLGCAGIILVILYAWTWAIYLLGYLAFIIFHYIDFLNAKALKNGKKPPVHIFDH